MTQARQKSVSPSELPLGTLFFSSSGVRRGTDVLKALALGADHVFVGRPMAYAAAIGGQAGVAHAVGLLRDEVHRDTALLGVQRLADLNMEQLVAV